MSKTLVLDISFDGQEDQVLQAIQKALASVKGIQSSKRMDGPVAVLTLAERLPKGERDKVAAYMAQPLEQQRRRDLMIARNQAQQGRGPPQRLPQQGQKGPVRKGKPASQAPPRAPVNPENARIRAISRELQTFKVKYSCAVGSDGKINLLDERVELVHRERLKELLTERQSLVDLISDRKAANRVPVRDSPQNEGSTGPGLIVHSSPGSVEETIDWVDQQEFPNLIANAPKGRRLIRHRSLSSRRRGEKTINSEET